MNRKWTIQWVKLVVVIVALAIAVFFDPLAIAECAFIKIDARAEEKATEEALEPVGNQEPKVIIDETEIIGTDPVETVLLEKGNMEPTIMPLRVVTEEIKAEKKISKPKLSGDDKNVAQEAENAEEWVDMHICVDVATIYESPDGDVLEEGYFTTKVEVSSEECKDGWCKIRFAEDRVGYIKAENLMSANQMLDNFRYLFAQILYAEAGGVSMGEMRLVGEVVLNRLTTDYWEFEPYCTSLWGVLSQSGQYPDTLRKIRNGLVPSEDALEVARALLLDEYESLLPDDCLWQTGFYPSWNVEIVRYPGEWKLDDGTVINVYQYYSVLVN